MNQQSKVTPTETEQKVFDIWKKILERDDFTLEDDFYDLDATSLQAFRLLGEIKNVFGIELELMYVLQDITVKSLAELIEKKL